MQQLNFGLIAFFALVCSTRASLANVVGVDTQNFNPITSGLDFVTVHSSETLAPGVFNLGLFVNYAVNTLPFYSRAGQGGKSSRLGKTRDALTSLDMNVGMGIASFWDIGLSFPFLLNQEVHGNDDRGEFEETGMTEIRANTKVRVLGDRSGGVAFIASINQNMIDNNPYVGENAGPIFNLEVAGDTVIAKRLALGLNLGYRWRDKGEKIPEYPIEPIGNQYIASAAASLHFPSADTKVIFEVFGSAPEKETSMLLDRQQRSAEALLGLKHDFSSSFAGHLGAGTELDHAVGSPDWRVYIGTNVTFGPLFAKNEERVMKKAHRKMERRPRPPKPAEHPVEDPPITLEPAAPGEEYASDADETFVVRDVLFEFDSDSQVGAGAKDLLAQIGERASSSDFKYLIIEGHTDSVGSDEYNQDLGLRRAKMIRNYLVNNFRLDRNTIYFQSFGEARPVADNGNYQGRQMNRRVVFRFYYK